MLKINDKITSATAFAPATCANVAVGFDLLGFAVNVIGDEIILTRNDGSDIIIEQIESNEILPSNPDENVASAVIKRFCQEHKLPMNFSLHIRKGIPLGSGMGGSAASAVAAMVALNAFLSQPVDRAQLATYAIYGEEIACGHKHGDNVVSCLYGGMTLTRSLEPLDVIQLPVPDLFCILVHPKLRLDTQESRAILPNKLPLTTYVSQSANLASFIVALYENRQDLIKKCLHDVLVEPWRSRLVPGFIQVKNAALAAGALGSSLSGSGPSIFAFAPTEAIAKKVKIKMIEAFMNKNIESNGWVSRISDTGATLIKTSCDLL